MVCSTAQSPSDVWNSGFAWRWVLRQAKVLRLVFAEGMKLNLLGLAMGLSGSLIVARLARNQFFGVEETDWVTYAIVAAVLIATAGLAAYLPVRAVLATDPIETLRHD